MVLWPNWENLFNFLLHSYSYIKTLLLLWTGILIFINYKGNEDQQEKLWRIEGTVLNWVKKTMFGPSYREFQNVEGSRKRDSGF